MSATGQDTMDAFLKGIVEEIATLVAAKLRDQQPETPRMLKAEQVGQQLGISTRSAREMISGRDGNPPKLASLKVGPDEGSRVVEQGEVDRYIQERKAAG
jgi:hypothetical protein